ncbi:TPM domain-containing protein [Skermania piniformis]|uniref:TPM domain-containing protein n=1 Tax=Skermania pinensis TaxID=39122 RepID=A0ABX8SAS1_9ACTN|nr:TPM domain-containing protein [Skermania piniformis]QXQ14965.1 TPM domain-containing protein [Skermania piniformis]
MRRIFALLFTLAALTLLPFTLAAPASAESPLNMPGQLIDHARALDSTGRAAAQQQIDDLYNAHRIKLWVIYTADFSGLDPATWADRTVQLSSFGDRDVLLAVATEDRAYYFSASSALPGVTAGEITDIQQNAVEPALRQRDWAAAAVAAASGLSDAAASTSGISTRTVLIGGGVAVVGAGGALLYARRRRRGRAESGAATARTIDPSDTAALAGLPVAALDVRSREVLVEIDNAVRTSSEELELARGEFGDEAVRPFVTALNHARAALARAFAIRQQLDDDQPETEQQQRDLLVELISRCGVADRELDARVDEFDGMRNLLINADQRLDALTRQSVDLSVRIPKSEATYTQLTQQYPASVLAPIASNVTMAKERAGFADQSLVHAREAVALPAGKQGPAVPAIRAAESALTQAGTLLDAVDTAAGDIRTAVDTLPQVLDDAKADVAAATGLAAFGGDELARARAATETAIAQADPVNNPLGSYRAIVTADTALEQAVATAGDRRQTDERLRQQLAQALTAARAQVGAAADFIGTRRGAVDAEARTRLAEAQRNLDQAQQLQTSDPAQATRYAQAAADLGARALSSAQSDVRQWEAQRRDSRGGNNGAILGGIILDSVLRGGFGSGSHGNRWDTGGHGHSPGSFGGAGSSRRIGGGGRF